eukprot:903568-Amphidinium_carterae.1
MAGKGAAQPQHFISSFGLIGQSSTTRKLWGWWMRSAGCARDGRAVLAVAREGATLRVLRVDATDA